MKMILFIQAGLCFMHHCMALLLSLKLAKIVKGTQMYSSKLSCSYSILSWYYTFLEQRWQLVPL